MLLRIKPIGNNSEAYLQLLLANIDQEFDHNMVQQLYISDECWKVIIASKIATINSLKETESSSKTANDFRENVFLKYSKKSPHTDTAIDFLKNEVKKMI